MKKCLFKNMVVYGSMDVYIPILSLFLVAGFIKRRSGPATF